MANTSQESLLLEIKLVRTNVEKTQPDKEIRKHLRLVCQRDDDSLTMETQVIAMHFQIVATVNLGPSQLPNARQQPVSKLLQLKRGNLSFEPLSEDFYLG